MRRLSPRAKENTTARIFAANGRLFSVQVENIGLNGVQLSCQNRKLSDTMPGPGSSHNIALFLPGTGDLTLNGNVVWKNKEKLGFQFATMPRGELFRIWEHMRDSLLNETNCPFCDHSSGLPSEKCKKCGWALNFDDKEYLAYWERESLLRGLRESLDSLNTEDIYKVTHYIHHELHAKAKSPSVEEIEEVVGTCRKMKDVFSLIRKVAPTDLPLLILGESGTGKNLVARAIHERSLRKDKPFASIDCAAIPPSLIEAELFGYERGAFTGAYRAKKGKFEYADQGTLFLDEIGEIPLSLQSKLLRFLESQEIERIGSLNRKTVDVRVIAATNMDLEKAVASRSFRFDLYYRIKVFTIHLPPVRDREEDKIILARYFLRIIMKERDWQCKGFSPEAIDAIRKYSWPGNVREMINKIRRALVVQDKWITPRDLELESDQTTPQVRFYKDATSQHKKDMILSALRENNSNISHTAKYLGVSRSYLYTLIKKLEIHVDRQ